MQDPQAPPPRSALWEEGGFRLTPAVFTHACVFNTRAECEWVCTFAWVCVQVGPQGHRGPQPGCWCWTEPVREWFLLLLFSQDPTPTLPCFPKASVPGARRPPMGQGCGWLSHFMTSTLGPPGPSVLRSGSPFSNPHSATHWNPGGMLAWVGAPGGAYCTQVKVCDPGAGLALLPECCIFCLPCVVSWTETGTGTWTWHHGAQGSSRACRSHLRCPWHTLGTQSARSKAVYPPHSLF